MSKPITRDGPPPLRYPTCPHCGFDAIHTTDVPGHPALEQLACGMCHYRWTIARVSKHVQSVTRSDVIVDDLPLPHPLHRRRVAASPAAAERWDCLVKSRLNALVIGPGHLTRRVVRSLRPHLARPIVRVRSHMPLMLPPGEKIGTVILEDIHRLDMAAQKYVREWLEEAVPRVRVISTSTARVLPMVERGLFDDTLYYRLNVLYFLADECH